MQSPSGAWPPVDPGILFPEDGDFRLPGVEDDALVTWSVSTNGLDEYTASNFQGALQGNLITAAFDKSIYRIIVDPSNGSATKEVLAEGLGGMPLDVIAQGDTDPFAGTIWIGYVGGPGRDRGAGADRALGQPQRLRRRRLYQRRRTRQRDQPEQPVEHPARQRRRPGLGSRRQRRRQRPAARPRRPFRDRRPERHRRRDHRQPRATSIRSGTTIRAPASPASASRAG